MALDVHDIRQLLCENGVEDAAVELHRRLSGLNLEDIKAPGCFEIERRLRDQLDVPVIHDDQHGTAVVVFAALLTAARVTGRKLERARVVIVGAGADGSGMAEARSQSSRPRPTRFLARHLASERRPWRPHVRGRIVSCLRGWRSFACSARLPAPSSHCDERPAVASHWPWLVCTPTLPYRISGMRSALHLTNLRRSPTRLTAWPKMVDDD